MTTDRKHVQRPSTLRSLDLQSLQNEFTTVLDEIALSPRWEASSGYKFLEGVYLTDVAGTLWFTKNAVYDGSIWQKVESGNAFAFVIEGSELVIRTAGTGSGTISWSDVLRVHHQELGLYNSVPVTQAAAVGKLTNSMTATTTDGDLESIGDTSAGDQSAAIERNFSELEEKLEAIIDALGDSLGVGVTSD